MLGKVLDQGQVAVVYSPIIKTSNSGLFGNKRLAILSLQHSILGYLSKLPDNFDTFQDLNCARNCKEKVSIKQQPYFAYYISTSDQATLILKWPEKTWEFKFQNADIAKQWYRYIYDILNLPVASSPQPKDYVSKEKNEDNANINFSKLSSISRFLLSEAHPDQEARKSRAQLKRSAAESKDQILIQQERAEQIKDKEGQSECRFKQFQRDYKSGDESVTPVSNTITTFRERFPNNTIFSSVKKSSPNSESDYENANNWNLIWFEAIQSEEEQVRISIYNGFLRACEEVCKEILTEVTMLKQYRKHVPARISASEEVYKSKKITFHLILEKEIENSDQQLCSDHLLSQFRKMQQNYTFLLKATKNKGLIKVPLSCIYQYRGFSFFCEADISSQFQQVDHSNIFIFYPQLQRLEEQLKIKLSLSHLDLFTNKLSSIVEPQLKRNHYLIIKHIRRLLPEAILHNKSEIIISKEFFLQSNTIYSKDYDFSQEKARLIKNFHKGQDNNCSIISYEDLRESLEKDFLTYSSLPELIPPCQNRYLTKLFLTEHISEIFCHIVRTEMMIFVKKWNKDLDAMLTDETPDYQGYIFQLLSQFLSEHVGTNLRIWNIIRSRFHSRLGLTIKMEEIIIGYLLTSISLKLGINLDFQLLLLQRFNFFNQSILISPQALKSFESVFVKYANEDMCDSYEAMLSQLENHEDQRTINNVQRFYRLKQENFQPKIEPFLWRKICKLFSFYVPYESQEEYEYLTIYNCLNFFYLDYSNFSILVSAIKWLFHANRPKNSLQFLQAFKDICWFWVSDNNPFLLELYSIVGQYYRITGNLIQSVEYISRCNQFYSKLIKGDTELKNCERNRKLAEIYMSCNLHKQSLKKYLQVKTILRKTDKDSLNILDVLVQISKLYLHLGDIENCSKTCKQTIEFSTFNPFQNELQEYQIYSILLRSFQIQEEYSKYKFYVDIIQQKFKFTKNPIILQNLLRLIVEQILQRQTKYHLKKIAFILYYYQNKMPPADQELSTVEIFRKFIKEIGIEQPCEVLRYCIEKKLAIADLIAQRQTARETNEGQAFLYNGENTKFESIFQIMCRFIGFQFIIAHVAKSLNKK